MTRDDPYYSWRRLLAAVVVRAARDVYAPEKRTPKRARRSARQFLADAEVRAMYEEERIKVPVAAWATPPDEWADCRDAPGSRRQRREDIFANREEAQA